MEPTTDHPLDKPRFGYVLGLFSAFGFGASLMAPSLFWIGAAVCYFAGFLTLYRYKSDLLSTCAINEAKPSIEMTIIVIASFFELALPTYLIYSRVSGPGLNPDTITDVHYPLDIGAFQPGVDFPEGTSFGGIAGHYGYAFVKVQVSNSSASAYDDVSVTIQPQTSIIQSASYSDFTKCAIAPAIEMNQPIVMGADKGGAMAAVSSEDQPGSWKDSENTLIRPADRLICPDLPSGATVDVYLATVVISPNPTMGPMWVKTRHDPSFIDLIWTYTVLGKQLKGTGQLNFKPS